MAAWADTAHQMELVRKLGTPPPVPLIRELPVLLYRSWRACRCWWNRASQSCEKFQSQMPGWTIDALVKDHSFVEFS